MIETTKDDLCIVIPIYNESGNLEELYTRVRKVAEELTNNYKILFVNDCSTDESLQIIQKYSDSNRNVQYLSFSRNFGHQQAISAGLQYSNARSVVTMDGDLQDPPEVIYDMYKKYKEGNSIVYAKRNTRKGESLFKKSTAYVFYRLLSMVANVKIPMDTGDFRLIDQRVVSQVKQMNESNLFLRGLIAWTGYKHAIVEYERDARKFGKTGYSVQKMIRLSIDAITAFSDFPLKFASLLGFTVSFIAFLIILYALYSKFVLHMVVTGWTSLLISTMFIGGIQLLAIGIIGEYISRINNNVRNRPNFIVEESNIIDIGKDV